MFVSSHMMCNQRWRDRMDGSVTDRLVVFAYCEGVLFCFCILLLQYIFVEKYI